MDVHERRHIIGQSKVGDTLPLDLFEDAQPDQQIYVWRQFQVGDLRDRLPGELPQGTYIEINFQRRAEGWKRLS